MKTKNDTEITPRITGRRTFNIPNATKFSVGFFIVPGSAAEDQSRSDDNHYD